MNNQIENGEIIYESKEGSDIEKWQGETWQTICEYQRQLDHLKYLKCLVELEKIKANT